MILLTLMTLIIRYTDFDDSVLLKYDCAFSDAWYLDNVAIKSLHSFLFSCATAENEDLRPGRNYCNVLRPNRDFKLMNCEGGGLELPCE